MGIKELKIMLFVYKGLIKMVLLPFHARHSMIGIMPVKGKDMLGLLFVKIRK